MGRTYTSLTYHLVFSTKYRRKTFADEFLAILDAHGIAYDPKFVFEREHYG